MAKISFIREISHKMKKKFILQKFKRILYNTQLSSMFMFFIQLYVNYSLKNDVNLGSFSPTIYCKNTTQFQGGFNGYTLFLIPRDTRHLL